MRKLWNTRAVGQEEMNSAAASLQGQKSCLFHAFGSLWRRNNGKNTVILAFTWSLVIKKGEGNKTWEMLKEDWRLNLKDTNDPLRYTTKIFQ